jgi:CO/xanthine dehydrogenase FAD-binding subunit
VAPSFGFAQPRHVSEAFDILDGYGREASLLAGGTDLIVGLRKGRIAPRMIVDLKRISVLAPGITETEGRVSITAATPLSQIIGDPRVQDHFPALVEAARTVGSVQIRNRATLTGNICNASPAADTAPALLAYGAAVVLVSRRGSRRLPVGEFLLGPRRTSLGAHEIAAAVEIPVTSARTGSQFTRLTRRRGVDLATVSLCCTVGSQVTRFAFGAVGPRPFMVADTSGVLADPDSNHAARTGLLRDFVAQATPISDLRGSREYRQAMLLALSERTLRAAIGRRDQT